MYYDAFHVYNPDQNQAKPSDSEDDVGDVLGNKTGLEFGPHSKFSRGDANYALGEELEEHFICSVDLLLDVFSKPCQQ